MAQDELVKQLTGELRRLAERTIARAYDPTMLTLDLSQLEAIARRAFRQEWEPDREATLEHMIRKASESRQLTGRLNDISWQLATLLLFNLDGGSQLPGVEPLPLASMKRAEDSETKLYGYLRERLMEKAGYSEKEDSKFRRHLQNLRTALAAVLLDPDFPSDKPAERTQNVATGREFTVKPVAADVFIPRPKYEGTIRELRDAGVKRIWLHGDAGTGKTRLARAANRDVISETAVPVLDGSDRLRFERQIASLLVQSGTKSESINSVNLWPSFVEWLQTGQLPVVVLDNMPSDRVKDLMEVDSATLLIFTSVGPPLEAYRGRQVEVVEMEAAEALAMTQSRLPALDEARARRLFEALGGRPLAIEHSCAYLRETGTPVDAYCRAIREAPDKVLDAAGSRHDKTLTGIYRLTVAALNDVAPDALRVLDYLIFTISGVLNFEMLAHLWSDTLAVSDPSSQLDTRQTLVDRYSFAHIALSPGVAHLKPMGLVRVNPTSAVLLRAALRHLEDFGLVRAENNLFVVHQLTQAILGAIRADRKQYVDTRIRSTVYQLTQLDHWNLRDTVPFVRVSWAFLLIPIFVDLGRRGSDYLNALPEAELAELGTLVVFTHRSLHQMGADTGVLLPSMLPLMAAVMVRVTHPSYDIKQQDTIFDQYVAIQRILAERAVSTHAFDRSFEGMMPYRKDPVPELVSLAIEARLHNDTEWQLAHQLGTTKTFEAEQLAINSSGAAIAAASATVEPLACVARYKELAHSSILMATIYYDSCRWNDAIAALEHAYSCYLKIGADAECTRGVIDAARRLAKVHLRAGHLNDAAIWLMRANWLFQVRSETRVSGMPLRFRIVDERLQVLLHQVQTQLELTNFVNRGEFLQSDDPDAEIRAFCVDKFALPNGELSPQSRVGEADDTIKLFNRIGERRLLPEAQMHAYRLRLLLGDVSAVDRLGELAQWFTRDNLTYQADLLSLQVEVSQSPALPVLAGLNEQEIREVLEAIPVEAHNAFLLKVRQPVQYTQNFYVAVRQMWEKHQNWYWYARGLCACFVAAESAGHPTSWIDGLRKELEHAATFIDRVDWIERTYAFDGNLGIWLYGY